MKHNGKVKHEREPIAAQNGLTKHTTAATRVVTTTVDQLEESCKAAEVPSTGPTVLIVSRPEVVGAVVMDTLPLSVVGAEVGLLVNRSAAGVGVGGLVIC